MAFSICWVCFFFSFSFLGTKIVMQWAESKNFNYKNTIGFVLGQQRLSALISLSCSLGPSTEEVCISRCHSNAYIWLADAGGLEFLIKSVLLGLCLAVVLFYYWDWPYEEALITAAISLRRTAKQTFKANVCTVLLWFRSLRICAIDDKARVW